MTIGRRALLATMTILTAAACGGGNPEIECLNNDTCDRFDDGLCTVYELTGRQWCTYPDGHCDSGRRWSDLDVGDGLEDTCVAEEIDAGPDAPSGIDASIDAGYQWDGLQSIVTGAGVTCARDDGEVRCWGGNQGTLGYGYLDVIGDDEPASAGGVVNVGAPVTAFSLQQAHVCVILDEDVKCWGQNTDSDGVDGRLGYGNGETIGDDEVPATVGTVDIGFSVANVAAGGDHTCALSNNGSVVCWGRGASGVPGHGNTDNIGDDESPASAGPSFPGRVFVSDVVAGGGHVCVLLQSGSVRCWGSNDFGQLGYGNVDNLGDDETSGNATDVSLGGTVIQLAAGATHTCAILEGGSVRCWGDGAFGMLGTGGTDTIGNNELPTSVLPVNLGGAAVQITAGVLHTCALLEDGDVRCWGYGQYGALGYGNTDNIGDDEVPSSIDPVDVGGDVVEVRAGSAHTCARLTTGAIRCWGRASDGALGYGSTANIGDSESPASAGDVPYR